MADPIYSAIALLDGYVADRDGRFDWAVPDDDAFRQLKASAAHGDAAAPGPQHHDREMR